jgi:ABC-2 type transport system permease protein
MSYQEYMGQSFFGPPQLDLNPSVLAAKRRMSFGGQETFTLAAHVKGARPAEESKSESAEKEKDAKDDPKSKARPIDVVYVCDLDMLGDQFLALRANPTEEIRFNFENVTFVLNVIDSLAGENDFIAIRKRKPHYGSLKMVELRTEESREQELKEQQQYRDDFDKAVKDANKGMEDSVKELQEVVDELRKRSEKGEDVSAELQAAVERLNIKRETAQQRFDAKRKQLELQRDRQIKSIRRDVDLEVRKIQTGYKLWAVVLPPIPPLLVGLVVFVRRRLREREGISRSRMR